MVWVGWPPPNPAFGDSRTTLVTWGWFSYPKNRPMGWFDHLKKEHQIALPHQIFNCLNISIWNLMKLFATLWSRDFSNNHIGGTIPSILPLTIRNLYVKPHSLPFPWESWFSKLLLFCYVFKYPILTLFESFIYYTCLVLFRITNSLEASPTVCHHQVN